MRGRDPAGKIFGLDVMRAVSGVMVLLGHTSHLVAAHWPRFPAVPAVDWVALFFVLSGFLIGGILLDALGRPGPARLRFLDFMQRRWLRTLPNYYLFLLLNIALVAAGSAPGMLGRSSVWYAVFMQNFHKPLDLFFWESWSLAVEEWFYLLFPLIVFGLVGLLAMRGERAFLAACAVFLLIPLAARWAVAPQVHDHASWALWVKKLTLTRLDAPGMGMLFAWLARRFAERWQLWRRPAFVIGAGALLALGRLDHGDVPTFMLLGYESLYALAIALLLPLLSAWRSGGVFTRSMRGLSLITYALYLVHLPMLYLWGHLVPDPVAWKCALHYALFIASALALATLVYRYWERPFMRMRDPLGRWLEARFSRA
jgi:peptidoglycan/LPS O-acetylase OafA/YrhL